MAKNPSESDKDTDPALAVIGRVQKIGPHPDREVSRSTLAAGAVVWRYRDDSDTSGESTDCGRSCAREREYALIHRPCYDDWSLAKGKVDPGESIPVTAIREIREETGFSVVLGKLIGTVSYPVRTRTKIVYYFTAQLAAGEFTPNDEVDELVWLPLDEAKKHVTYEVDREVLTTADRRLSAPELSRLLLIRHAHAFSRHKWSGNDDQRPLDKRGVRQTSYLPAMVHAFGPTAVLSAEPDRCVATATPIAERCGLEVVVDEIFGDHAWVSSRDQVASRITSLVSPEATPVVVSQGLLIPEFISLIARHSDLSLDEVECKKASMWALTFSASRLVGADYFASPLPIK